jgi:two-component system cell cycle response regulator CtrA
MPYWQGVGGCSMKMLLNLLNLRNEPIRDYLLSFPEIQAKQVTSIKNIIEYIQIYGYDCVVTDQVLTPQKASSFFASIRSYHLDCLFILVASDGRLSDSEIISYLDTGFDKVINYEVSSQVLVAMIRAFVRRLHGLKSSTIEVGLLKIDLSKHQVFLEDAQIDLTKKELILLECLALNKGKVLSKEFLLEYIYGGIDEPEIRIIDAFIWRIRKKLADSGLEKDYMQTVWGRGYRLSDKSSID